MSLLQFTDVSKVYSSGGSEVRALDGVSFELEKGDFVAITGPSGSGKSTLLSILGLLNTPTKGRVLIDDVDVYKLSTERKADFRYDYLGFIFQSFHLIPYLSVKQNVMLPLAVSKISEKEQAKMAESVLERVGLSDKLASLPSQISGGQLQRVAIARAIVNKPDILLADEPTGNLDTKTGHEILELIESLNKEGETILMVTHDRELAKKADQQMHIVDGRIDEVQSSLKEKIA